MSKIKTPADSVSEGEPFPWVTSLLLTAYVSGGDGSLCSLVYKDSIHECLASWPCHHLNVEVKISLCKSEEDTQTQTARADSTPHPLTPPPPTHPSPTSSVPTLIVTSFQMRKPRLTEFR